MLGPCSRLWPSIKRQASCVPAVLVHIASLQVLDKDFVLPIGKAKVQRVGKDVTLVSFSKMVGYCLKAADALAQQGIDAEVRINHARWGCHRLPPPWAGWGGALDLVAGTLAPANAAGAGAATEPSRGSWRWAQQHVRSCPA